jgi:protein-L-isoaspartate(D-aspartate) O-methyltransferase
MSSSGNADAMLRAVVADYRSTAVWTGLAEPSAAVLAALRRVPRDRFVPAEERGWAWHNTALSIGRGQTISQPFIVALMSDLLRLRPGDRVLEIGTGCGYQAAVLAALGAAVYSLEFDPELAREAAARLEELGYPAVLVRCGDGGDGWPEEAPFDRILATAAAPRVPEAWFAQLAPGGRLVAPVGPDPEAQELVLWRKAADGSLAERRVLRVRFVPLRGRHGRA